MLSDGHPCAKVKGSAAATDGAAVGDGIDAEVPPWLHTSVTTHNAALPPDDRSFDRNEQHHAALGHHPANTAHPHRTVRLGVCLHLLIAGSPHPARAVVPLTM